MKSKNNVLSFAITVGALSSILLVSTILGHENKKVDNVPQERPQLMMITAEYLTHDNDKLVLEKEVADLKSKLADSKSKLKTFKSMHEEFSNIAQYEDLSLDIQLYIYAISLEYDVNPALILAIVHNESRGQVKATGRNRNGTTDSGLMQINSSNHEWLKDELGVTDFYDPYQNIRCGTYIIKTLLDKYDGNIHQSLMAYNMGSGRVKELNKQGIYSTEYSRKVVNKMEELSYE